MKLNQIQANNAPAASGPYSHAVTAGGFAFVSGQIPVDPATGMLVEGIKAQTKQSMENCLHVLEACGAKLTDVVKVTVFLQDMDQFAAMNQVYGEYFHSHKPARACVEVSALPKGASVEIEMIAYIG